MVVVVVADAAMAAMASALPTEHLRLAPLAEDVLLWPTPMRTKVEGGSKLVEELHELGGFLCVCAMSEGSHFQPVLVSVATATKVLAVAMLGVASLLAYSH